MVNNATYADLFKEGVLSGFLLVKISKVHFIRCLLNQNDRKLKDHIFLVQIGIEIVIKD